MRRAPLTSLMKLPSGSDSLSFAPRRAAILRMVAVLCLWPLIIAIGAGEDWPQWQGPNRNNVWNEVNLLQTFPREGLKIRWSAEVGPGWSSPVVAQGRVYVTDSQLIRPKARERVHCLD